MDATDPALPQSEKLWFLDGTLVLRTNDCLFRVFRGILAWKSPVFQDMFAFPQPLDEEVYDGCPLVHLPDSTKDINHFLSALLDYEYFPTWPTRVDFDVVASVLRMSQKYQVAPLRKRALEHVSRLYPISLQEFDFKVSRGWLTPDPTAVVNLARHVSADWILAPALLLCAWLDPQELMDGSLSKPDIALCLRASNNLQTKWASRVLHFLWDPTYISGCQSPESCPQLRVDYRARAEDWRGEQMDVFNIWGESDWETGGASKPCDVCLRFMNSAWQESRHACWDDLPALFNLHLGLH
ncbi:hypothetical protein C8R45DRAFT_879154 [Mycena sanguinolenta]|nr:hypothetical protein C8R45DRAFT_879154 [Mycena sanguinolenta]